MSGHCVTCGAPSLYYPFCYKCINEQHRGTFDLGDEMSDRIFRVQALYLVR